MQYTVTETLGDETVTRKGTLYLTSAEPDYDWPRYTRQMGTETFPFHHASMVYDTHFRQDQDFRLVWIQEGHEEYQIGRYTSGMHVTIQPLDDPHLPAADGYRSVMLRWVKEMLGWI